MRIHHVGLAILLATFAMVGCKGNAVLGPHDGGNGPLNVELTLSSGHVHILSPLAFTVKVTDAEGDVVVDFELLKVERLAVGSETWRAIELTKNGAVYEAEYTFSSSGDYMLRVVGKRPSDAEEVVLYEAPDPITAVRAHAEAGGLRVEFETFPGHIHQHNTVMMKFWILEQERNDDGVRPPIPGLQTTVLCNEADGSTEEHAAVEESAGVYVAEHEFESVGDFVAGLRFPGTDGGEAIVEFTTHVVPGH